MKCPRCHEGEFYKTSNPYDLPRITEMHQRCPVCNQTYEPEPNFYYGSMYVSYAYSVALFILVGFLGAFVFDWGLWTIIGALTLVLVLLGPLIFRLSRITWINFFVKYNKIK